MSSFARVSNRCWISADVPTEIHGILVPLLRKWEIILPGWLERLQCYWDEKDESAAQMIPHFDYRHASLYVRPNFLAYAERREYLIVHEMCHTLNEPMLNVADDLKDLLIKAHPAIEDYWKELVRYAIEQATTDMATALMRIHGEPSSYRS